MFHDFGVPHHRGGCWGQGGGDPQGVYPILEGGDHPPQTPKNVLKNYALGLFVKCEVFLLDFDRLFLSIPLWSFQNLHR